MIPLASPFTDTTYLGLVRAVLHDPADDGPRLVLADWLRGEGDGDRADFIQWQIELATMRHDPKAHLTNRDEDGRLTYNESYNSPHCDACKLRTRSADLLARHGRDWFADLWALLPKCGQCEGKREVFIYNNIALSTGKKQTCNTCHGTGTTANLTFARGWPESIEIDGRTLWGGMCERCEGEGSTVRDNNGNVWVNKCDDCDGNGRTPGIGARLFSLAPFTQVTVTDAEPYTASINHWHHWYDLAHQNRHDPIHPQSDIPTCIFERIEAQPIGRCKEFPTAPLANAALSDAIVAHYRAAAGMPELDFKVIS